MIGCEKLCGRCEACDLVVWALQFTLRFDDEARVLHQVTNSREHQEHQALVAVGEASDLAELIARALRGRGVDVHMHETQRAWAYDCMPGANLFVTPDGEHIGVSWDEPGKHWAHFADMPRARATLSNFLAAGLCGFDEAKRLLGES